MRLLRAHIENFTCLGDIALEFSTDRNRNVMLIRAENGNGKTTLCTALEWGLYGDSALEETAYPLVPPDLALENTVRISVACDYEVSGAAGKARRYRLVRSASESIWDGVWHRSPTTAELFILLPEGPVPVEDPESLISTHFPARQQETRLLNHTRCAAFTEPDTHAVEAAFEAFGLDARVLTRVSDRMNALFLDMVGGHTADIGTSRASITADFQLVTSEPNGAFRLAWVQLGGSARYALAIAFLFALIDVSGIETFTVVDAPLACLDLEPGRTALRQAGQRDAQLVLLMSSREIDGREDLLDRCMDRGYTLTICDDFCRIRVVL